jgi:hypothetical protein
VTFDNVRLLAVEGRKGKEQDVLLNFANGQVVVAAKKGGSPITSMTYKRIGAATYVHAKEPRWAGGASAAPPTDLDLPGGLFSGSRHWLVLQSTTGYIILRLEDENWRPVLATLESRTGVPTIRPALGK